MKNRDTGSCTSSGLCSSPAVTRSGQAARLACSLLGKSQPTTFVHTHLIADLGLGRFIVTSVVSHCIRPGYFTQAATSPTAAEQRRCRARKGWTVQGVDGDSGQQRFRASTAAVQRRRIPAPEPGAGAEGGEGSGQDAHGCGDGETRHFQRGVQRSARSQLVFEVLYMCIIKDQIQV